MAIDSEPAKPKAKPGSVAGISQSLVVEAGAKAAPASPAPALPVKSGTRAAKPSIAAELARRLPELFSDSPFVRSVGTVPNIPAILLEGDRPVVAVPVGSAAGVSARLASEGPVFPAAAAVVSTPPAVDAAVSTFASAQSGPVVQMGSGDVPASVPLHAEFPAAGTLWLTARDPFCVCAHWELADAALANFAAANPGGNWWLRLRAGSAGGWLVNEQSLPATVNFRFIPVVMAGSDYVAEIGFRFGDGSWRGLTLSLPATTPPDGPAEFSAEAAVVHVAADPVTPEILFNAPPDHPAPVSPPVPLPTPLRAQRLTALVWEPVARLESPSSTGAGAWQARTLVAEFPGEAASVPAGEGMPFSGELAGVAEAGLELPASDSAAPPVPGLPPGFWFKVNAELIIYGSTEPDARVTIAARPVALRPDGSFSFRFALPDGDFTLPAVAVNAAGTDTRSAQLRFTRATVLAGEVGAHPQDARLKPPVAEAIAEARSAAL